MSDDVSMIFFHKERFGLAEAATALAERGLAVTRQANRLTVRWGNGPELYITRTQGDWVRQEATEIGEDSPHATEMRLCDARLEISFNSLDDVLDEINTLIEVQITLQVATQGFSFNTWNGNVSGPDT